MDNLYLALLILLVLIAMAAGLWFGNYLGTGKMREQLTWKNIQRRLRKGVQKATIAIWKKSRKKRNRD